MFWGFPVNWAMFLPELTPFGGNLMQKEDHKLVKTEQQVCPEDKILNPEAIKIQQDLTAQELMEAGYQNTKKPWSQQEDKKLKILIKKRKKDWSKIAKGMPGRNQKMCYSRYRRIKSTSRLYWKKVEDEKIINLVNQFGENWKKIGAQFQDRTPKQLKQHYVNYLHPDINKTQWSLQDDLRFIELLNQNGKNWGKIKCFLEGRTSTQLKNRYFGRIKKLMEKKIIKSQIKNQE